MGKLGEKKNNQKAAIRSHKRASQTKNCGSVLACNVSKGTLELSKKDRWNSSCDLLLVIHFTFSSVSNNVYLVVF